MSNAEFGINPEAYLSPEGAQQLFDTIIELDAVHAIGRANQQNGPEAQQTVHGLGAWHVERVITPENPESETATLVMADPELALWGQVERRIEVRRQGDFYSAQNMRPRATAGVSYGITPFNRTDWTHERATIGDLADAHDILAKTNEIQASLAQPAEAPADARPEQLSKWRAAKALGGLVASDLGRLLRRAA